MPPNEVRQCHAFILNIAKKSIRGKLRFPKKKTSGTNRCAKMLVKRTNERITRTETRLKDQDGLLLPCLLGQF